MNKKSNEQLTYKCKRIVGILFALFMLRFAIAFQIFALKDITTIFSDCKTFCYSFENNLINRKTDEDLRNCFRSFTNELLFKYLHYWSFKSYMLDIYGLTVKTLDLYKPVPYNPIVKLSNNQLSIYENNDVNIDSYANVMVNFKKHLEKKNITFVYVQAPHKCYKYQPNLPVGIVDYSNQIFDRFIQKVENSVSVIDMRDYYKLHPEKHYQLFYPGDSHWRPEYAFVTSQQIMKYLHIQCSCKIDPKVNNLENYKLAITDKKCNDISIRLGNLYFKSDMESQQEMIPDFYTHIAITSDPVMYVYEDPINYQGQYNSSLLNQLRSKMSVSNSNAINNKKVLFIGDSFSPSVMSFLTLNFTDIEYHALNYYQGNIFEDIERFNPDIVVLLLTAKILEVPGKSVMPSTKRYFEILTPPAENLDKQ